MEGILAALALGARAANHLAAGVEQLGGLDWSLHLLDDAECTRDRVQDLPFGVQPDELLILDPRTSLVEVALCGHPRLHEEAAIDGLHSKWEEGPEWGAARGWQPESAG